VRVHKDAFAYQDFGARWLAERKNACLFDDMGVGKTATAIWGCDLAGLRRILVVCPGIARITWQREFDHWQTLPRSIGVVVDTQYVPDADVVIASYNALLARPILTALLGRRWDRVICDEAHYLKNREATRTRAVFGALCDGKKGLVSVADGTWLLTGTPFLSGPHEAWTWARALFPAATVDVETYAKWEAHFCVTEPGIWNTRIVGLRNVADFTSRLRPHILRRLLDDVQPDLPPARYGHVVVEPKFLPPRPPDVPAEILAVIEAAKAQLIADEESFVSTEAADAQAWAQSVHLASLRRWTGVAKAPAVAEAILEDLANGLQKIVIFAVHREVIAIIAAAIPEALIIHGDTPPFTRQAHIDAFQNRVPGVNPRVLLANIEVASTNLTLTTSADIAFAETTWMPKDVMQGVRRCRRIGQTRSVLARVFSLRGSLDEAVNAVLVRRSNLTTQLEAEFNRVG
jgi:SWI/SNF-related matrix-associated actin-dependent regulator 1 of chromatin subfamily A